MNDAEALYWVRTALRGPDFGMPGIKRELIVPLREMEGTILGFSEAAADPVKFALLRSSMPYDLRVLKEWLRYVVWTRTIKRVFAEGVYHWAVHLDKAYAGAVYLARVDDGFAKWKKHIAWAAGVAYRIRIWVEWEYYRAVERVPYAETEADIAYQDLLKYLAEEDRRAHRRGNLGRGRAAEG